MLNKISKVLPNSIAEEVDIEVGDRLLSINGSEIKDIIDYRFLIADDYLELEIEKPSGEVWDIEIDKDYDEELGIEFVSGILDNAKTCTNKCIFCFVDQLPEGMRETLYFKDDDSRLSFLQGNFVTLTNMKEEEIDRIIAYRISPINVSVHTTNPELRVKMLNNRFAGKLYERMKRMAEAGIEMACQIVLCPGINDGKELERTIQDLYKLYPAVREVAVVPIGITRHREGLHEMKIFDEKSAAEAIESIKILQDRFMDEVKNPFVRFADEFYVMAGYDIPHTDFYGGFNQIEDGIGMLRALSDNVDRDIDKLKNQGKGSFTFITGKSAYNHSKLAAEKIMDSNKNININVIMIPNKFFGETITVTGLLTGTDIIGTLKENLVNDYIIIPDNVLKRGYEPGEEDLGLLLDNYTLSDIEKETGKEVIVVDFIGEDLIDKINEKLV